MIPVRLTAGFRLMQAAAGSPRRFRIDAYSGGKLRVKSFALPVVVDLSKLEAGHVQILLNHEETTDATVGMADAIDNNGRELALSGPITGTSPRVQGVVRAFDNGQRWEASIGCLIHETRDIHPGQTVYVNRQQQSGPFTLATRSTLVETSVLPLGADRGGTSVNLAAAAAITKGSAMSFEQWCEQMGIDPSKLTPKAKDALMQAFSAEQAPASDAPATAAASALVDLRAVLAADVGRVASIKAIAADHPKILQAAITNSWTPEQTENHVLKAASIHAPNSRFRSGVIGMDQATVITASLALTAGCRPEVLAKDAAFGERVVDAATTLEFRGASVHRLLRAAYESAGVTPPSGVVGDSYIRGAFECSRSLRASVGITTMSLPGILSNVANKLLLSAFESVPATWQNIAAVSDVPNFKEAKRYRLTTGHQFDEIPPGGEIKHITMDEEEYTNKAKTYGCIVGLTRQDIVNDDLGAFSTLLRDMVRGGMMSLEKAFYKLLLQTVAAGTFFTTGRGNYIEGAGTVLSITSLTQALATFSMMVDDRGDPLLMVPEVLLVPPALKNAAKLLTRDTSVIAVGVGGSAATVTDGNPHAGDYRPVTSPWLSNEQLTGYTATGWLLAAPPQGGAGLMEVCYLNGQKTPITEEGELDFNRLGVAMRAYWDYGVSMADYRFGLWSKGAA